jgi:hypothetical protein
MFIGHHIMTRLLILFRIGGKELMGLSIYFCQFFAKNKNQLKNNFSIFLECTALDIRCLVKREATMVW